MISISPRNWHSIFDLVHTVNACLEELNTFRQLVLTELQKSIRFDSSTFFLFDDNLVPTKPVALNIQEKYLRLYQTHFFRFNHFDPTYGCVSTNPAVVDSALFPFAEFKKSYFFNEFLKPQHLYRQLVLYLKSDRKLLGFIGLHRWKEHATFADWEVGIAQTVSPLLSQSLEKAQIFEKIKSDKDFMQAIVDRTSEGVLIVNADLKPLFINNTAQELFSKMKGKDVAFHASPTHGTMLPQAALDLCRELKHHSTHTHFPLTSLKKKSFLTVSKDIVYILTAEILDQRFTRSTTPSFLVTITKPSITNRHINEVKLKNELGFTQREIELVHYLFKGLKNSEIAERMFITEGTVKNHLRNIFDKIGVTTRTSLIYEILAL